MITPPLIPRERLAGQQPFQDAQQLVRDLDVGLVARMVECDQDLVGEASGLPRPARPRGDG